MDGPTLEGFVMGAVASIGCGLFVLVFVESRRRLKSSATSPAKQQIERVPRDHNPTTTSALPQPTPLPTPPADLSLPDFSMTHIRYSLQRIGDSPDDNCDAVCAANKALRFAVSDGASQSFNSGLWAQLLVNSWAESSGRATIDSLASGCAARWLAETRHEVSKVPNNDLLITKMKNGSSATFGGVRWVADAGSDGFWEAIVVGDVLLIVTELDATGQATVRMTVPVETLADFPTSPDQVSTSIPHLARRSTTIHLSHRPGIGFALLTDAVARYAVALCTRGVELSSVFPFIGEEDAQFSNWIASLRQSGQIDDDDSTVLFVQTFENRKE
jgi:hypothetical protein